VIIVEDELGSASAISEAPGDDRKIRWWLVERIGAGVDRLEGTTTGLAVIVVDLTRSGVVAGCLGRDASDVLARTAEARLRTADRGSDDVVRLTGDKLAVVLEDVTEEDAVLAAWRYIEATADPTTIAGQTISLDASAGVALTNDPGTNPEQLLRIAEAVARRAVQRGPACVEVCDDARLLEASAKFDLLGDLRRALERDELEIVYQPVFSIDDGSIRSVEALVRWRHPERGLLLPGEFVPLAEEMGLISRLGGWILRSSCQQVAEWRSQSSDSEGRGLGLSVNMSVCQLARPDIADVVRAALEESGLDPSALCLEITESVPIGSDGATVAALHAIRELGVKLAVDDFLTGYSSLEMLRQLPVQQLKIDHSFVASLGDPRGKTMVQATVDLAHALDLDVVAEGVEHAHQLAMLREMGCDLAQGWLLSHPLTRAQATDVLLALRDGSPKPARWSLSAPPSESIAVVLKALDAGAVPVEFAPVQHLASLEVTGYSVVSRLENGGSTISHPEAREAARATGRLAAFDWACAAHALTEALDANLHPNITLLIPFDPSTFTTPCPQEMVPVLQRALERLRVVVAFSARGIAEEAPVVLEAVALAREIGWGVALEHAGERPDALALLPVVQPDVVSLDLTHPQCTHQGVAAASVELRAYAERHGATILVEGVADAEDSLRSQGAGAAFGRGAHIGAPAAIPERTTMPHSVIPFLAAVDADSAPSPFALVSEQRTASVISKGQLLEVTAYLENRAVALGEATLVLIVLPRDLQFDPTAIERIAAVAKRCPATMVLGPAGCAGDERFSGSEVAADDPIGLEWDVIVLGPDYAAALVAQDLGETTSTDGTRRFTHVLTHDRALVRLAARTVLRRLSGRPAVVHHPFTIGAPAG
jgi:diguanylate cyclase (GGDEF)-like protein